MKFKKARNLDKVLNSLIDPYKERVTDVYKVIDGMLMEGMISKEEDIKNDHIAFRTLGVPMIL